MRYLVLIIALLLSACSTTEYTQYVETHKAVAQAKASAESARYDALARIAETGDPQSKIAAVMAIAMGQGGAQQQQTQIAAPTPAGTTALQWASVLVPGLTQIYGIQQNAKVAINSSNNAALTSANTMAAFVGVAGKIQAPVIAAPVTPQANVTTTTSTVSGDTVTSGDTLSGTGVLGSGNYSTQANPVTTTTTTSAPIVVPDVVQITPVVVPDVVQITPVVTP